MAQTLNLENELKKYEMFKMENLSLDMTRGKPCTEQLDLCDGLNSILGGDYRSESGQDCRNYGPLDSIKDMHHIFADVLNISVDSLLVYGSSSLNLEYDFLSKAQLFCLPNAKVRWADLDKVKFLCPSPGYDRHFLMTQDFGFELIEVPMTPDGPDMDIVEDLVANDPSIKGIWNVPVYSNPAGYTYSAECCERLAKMKAADDFVIMWDNAYFAHHLYPDNPDSCPDILALCEKYGHPNRVVEFLSTSKITYPGSGIAAVAANSELLSWIKKHMSFQSICSNNMNMLRHSRFLKSVGGIAELMKKHADILRPKFECVVNILERELGNTGFASWTVPKGGYFISLDLNGVSAKRVAALCKEVGVALTPAGNTFPYSTDVKDYNIRLAPSVPTMEDLEKAMQILCTCVKICALEQ